MADVDAILAKIKPSLPEVTHELYLNGKVRADWQDAERELQDRRRKVKAESLAGDPEARALAARAAELEAEMRESRVILRLRGLGRSWDSYIVKHPKREDNEIDADLGVNADTFFNEVLPLSIIELTTGDGETSEMVPDLYDAITAVMNDEQWSQLCKLVLALNRGSMGVPFSQVASKINQTSAGDSKQPTRSESRSSGTPAGSRKKLPSTSTTKKATSSARSRAANPNGTTSNET